MYETEIPGPTRKVPSPKHNDINEIPKNSKNQLSSGKDSSPKHWDNNSGDDDSYGSNEDEDIDGIIGNDFSIQKLLHFNPTIIFIVYCKKKLKFQNQQIETFKFSRIIRRVSPYT